MKTKFLTLVLFTGIATLMISSCSFLRGTGSASNDDSICSNYSKTDKSELEVGLIHKMTDLYQNGINKSEVKAISFDLETLKTYIYHIEMEAKKNNVASQDLGLRIYYARYPDKTTWNTDFDRDLSTFRNDPITAQYEFKHTLIMIPTKKVGSNHNDFNPYDIATYSNGLTPSYLPTSPEYNSAQTLPALPLTESTRGAQNHGGLYPPKDESGMDF